MRARRLSGTIWHVPRLALLAVVVLAISPAATGAESPTITISGTGDIAMAPAGGGAAGFFDSGIRKALRAHISLGNLEGTLATGGSSKCGPGSSNCFAFRAPPSYSTALKQAGFTIMNLANNHALDFGESGQAETIAALKRVGLRFTGRPGEIAVMRQAGTKVAFVGFAPYPWAQSLLDIEDAVDLVQKAERKADIVVVTMHAGAEGSDQQHVRPGPEWFLGEPRGNVVAFSHAVVRAGADLVVGHGPHVLRGIEWYRGRVIAYSLGNFLGNGTLNVSGRLRPDGGVACLAASRRLVGGRQARAGAADGRGPAACRLEPGCALDGTPAVASGLRAQCGAHLPVRDAAAARLAHGLATYHHPAVRTDLPSGTVTFLFTDVEGSTRLLHELGADAYAEALAEHRRAIRDACVAAGGVEVDTQGDAFFFAFPTAPGAILAVSAMTEALEQGPIRVRAGLHTGTPLLAEEGYVGDDVHRAARIAAAGHGGQVLVSSSTASLLGLELTDLGEHRFKDLGAPERVYQLGEDTFPPLKSLYRTNLPVAATSFLGREREVAEISDLLRDGARLLTLTGPGGTGKTRLAIHSAAEAAESFPDGLWWVPLSSLRDAHLLVSSLAQTLAVEEQAGQDLSAGVEARLAGRKALLILDNAEHLMPEVATGIAALRDIEGPTLLVTSRERLQLQGEHMYSVPSLADRDGIDLFVTRARAMSSAVERSDAVAELCSRLDNLPLAIELAAARTVVFSPEQLVERLSQRLDLLKAGRDADPRQQTLRATIEWSYDLLDSEEQRLFRALSVFTGGCTVRGSRGGLRRRPGHAPVAARQEPDPAARRERKPALLDAGNDSRAGGRTPANGSGGRGRQAPARRALPSGRALGEPRGGRPGRDAS